MSSLKSRFAFVLAGALAGHSALLQAQTLEPPSGVLGISANASVEVTRDLLSITFTTSRDGADANAVQSQLKLALDAALAEAKKAARPGQVDVQTGNFSLYPRYTTPSSGKQALNGWQGTAELIVEGRDLATIGALVGRITTMTVGRVGFRLSREAVQRVEADVIAEAIARFRSRADSYVRQFGYAGYTLREVTVSGSEPGQGPVRMMRMAPGATAAPAADALAVEAGKETVTASVSGTVQMK